MLFCKSTTVTRVVFSHYIKLNIIRTISCSVKTDNTRFVQIYCIATYKITNTKENPKHRTLLLQNIMADGRTMFRVHIMSQTNTVHTSTRFKGKYKIEVMTTHPKDERKNINNPKKKSSE
jgi:hypothetical protein